MLPSTGPFQLDLNFMAFIQSKTLKEIFGGFTYLQSMRQNWQHEGSLPKSLFCFLSSAPISFLLASSDATGYRQQVTQD